MTHTHRLDGPDWQSLMLEGADALERSVDELSQLDAKLGDGDHGVNVAAAMAHTRETVGAMEDPLPSDVLAEVATGFLDEMGGAAGALFGTFFRSMSRSFGDADAIDAEQLADAIETGTAAVQRRGKSAPGDKTMVDALAAAAEACRRSATGDRPMADVLGAVAAGARTGADATTDMVASRGRARYTDARSVGVADAGATTVAILFEAWERASTRGVSR